MGRAPCCDKTKVKRGPWSPEEDIALKNYVQTHGIGGNWIALPHKAGLKRCGKSCRLRWLNYLRPDIKHGGFTEEEDNIICNLYTSIGSRWSVIASKLPGRTDNDVKNYWNTKLKKKLLAAEDNNTRANNNSTIELSSTQFSATSVTDIEVFDHGNTGYFNRMDVNYYVQSFDPVQFSPSDYGNSSSYHEVSGFSDASFLGSSGEDDRFSMDFEFGSYDISNGYGFEVGTSLGDTKPQGFYQSVSN